MQTRSIQHSDLTMCKSIGYVIQLEPKAGSEM